MRERGKTSHKPIPLAEALTAWVKQKGFVKRMEQAVVVEDWAALVGPQIAKVAVPESVSPEGILRVRVSTAPWASELQMMTPRIIGRLNTGRPARPITSIRWIVGPLGPDTSP
jgi:predicted nucleic acid-binding Zn ribbon protein